MKYLYIALLLSLTYNTLHSQKIDNPVEIQLSFGVPVELPTISIFKKNGFPLYNQIDLRLQKKVTSHVFLGIEYQFTNGNFNKEFILNFKDDFLESETQIISKNYSIRKGLFNVGYTFKNKKENLETAAVLGLGFHSIDATNNKFYAFYDQFGSVNVDEEKDYTNLLLQLNLESTFYVNKNFGINFGIKTQYTIINNPIVFEGLFPETPGKKYDIFGGTSERISIKKNYFTIIPSIGIRYRFNKSKV